MQGIKTEIMRIQLHRVQEKKWTSCHEREPAVLAALGSSLWTSAINTTWICQVYFPITCNYCLYSSTSYQSVLAVGTTAYLGGLLLRHCQVGPSVLTGVGGVLSASVPTALPFLFPKLKFSGESDWPSSFLTHRRPGQKQCPGVPPNSPNSSREQLADAVGDSWVTKLASTKHAC